MCSDDYAQVEKNAQIKMLRWKKMLRLKCSDSKKCSDKNAQQQIYAQIKMISMKKMLRSRCSAVKKLLR